MTPPVLIRTEADLERVPDLLGPDEDDEFCVSLRFDEPFIAACCRLGYLPMAYRYRQPQKHSPQHLMLIKCHRVRQVLEFPHLHVSRSTRRRAGEYTLTVDRDLPGVLLALEQTWENNWLIPPYQAALLSLQRTPVYGVAVHSIEVYHQGDLVAGEVGYRCGGVYTSLSGFHYRSGAGAVQLAATAGLLERSGMVFWDLGMEAPYKTALGAQEVERREFLQRYRSAAAATVAIPFMEMPPQGWGCAELVAPGTASAPGPSSEPG